MPIVATKEIGDVDCQGVFNHFVCKRHPPGSKAARLGLVKTGVVSVPADDGSLMVRVAVTPGIARSGPFSARFRKPDAMFTVSPAGSATVSRTAVNGITRLPVAVFAGRVRVRLTAA